MSAVNHVFYEVHMGIGHRGCHDLLAKMGVQKLQESQAAVFLNPKWNAAKILFPNNTLLYWRSTTGASLSPEELRFLPTRINPSRLKFNGKVESVVINRWNGDVGSGLKRLRAVVA